MAGPLARIGLRAYQVFSLDNPPLTRRQTTLTGLAFCSVLIASLPIPGSIMTAIWALFCYLAPSPSTKSILPARKTFIAQLESAPIVTHLESEDRCLLCHAQDEELEEPINLPTCGHLFCRSCALTIFNADAKQPQFLCPLCRKQLIGFGKGSPVLACWLGCHLMVLLPMLFAPDVYHGPGWREKCEGAIWCGAMLTGIAGGFVTGEFFELKFWAEAAPGSVSGTIVSYCFVVLESAALACWFVGGLRSDISTLFCGT